MQRRILVERAREFREKATRGEDALWEVLRGRALGVRFYRQKVIGPFIADFACERPKLIIEVDGPDHEMQLEQDLERQRFLEDRGYRFIRATSTEAEQRPNEIAERIRNVLAEFRKSRGVSHET